MALLPIPIKSSPGIQRDGTVFAGDAYTDGVWTRFQRGVPRKMGGYREVTATLPQVPYGMRADMNGANIYVHIGSSAFLTQVVTDYQGVLTSQANRTPAGLAAGDYIWKLDTFVETLGGTLQIIGCPVASKLDIANNTQTGIYFGSLTGGAILTKAFGADPLGPDVSGGVVALWPFFMGYGSNGEVKWTAPNNLTAWEARYYVSGSKIVNGMPMRGNGDGPGVILWSLTDVIAGQYVGIDAVTSKHTFRFSTLSTQSSVLSSQGFVDWDGVYYWAGVDRFMMFNGVVSDVTNNMNVNWFFDNLNFSQRQKVFAYKVPRFNEIWWCFPFGNATDCTHAVVYNVKEKSWYDTILPTNMRTAGAFAQSYRFPFMCDARLNPSATGYTLWQHETGVDEIRNVPPSIRAILARIRTSDMSPLIQGQDMGLHIARTEPDFVQVGNMQVRVIGKANARAPDVIGEDFTFTPQPESVAENQPVNMKTTQRIIALEFESNVAGGDFEMGKILGYVQPQDVRNTGP